MKFQLTFKSSYLVNFVEDESLARIASVAGENLDFISAMILYSNSSESLNLNYTSTTLVHAFTSYRDFAITYALSFLNGLDDVQLEKLQRKLVLELEKDDVFESLKLIPYNQKSETYFAVQMAALGLSILGKTLKLSIIFKQSDKLLILIYI